MGIVWDIPAFFLSPYSWFTHNWSLQHIENVQHRKGDYPATGSISITDFLRILIDQSMGSITFLEQLMRA
jgi:hypothetical protein